MLQNMIIYNDPSWSNLRWFHYLSGRRLLQHFDVSRSIVIVFDVWAYSI